VTDRLPPTETGEEVLWHGRPSVRIVYGPGEMIPAAGGAVLLLYPLGGYFIVGNEGITGVGVALAFLALVAGFLIAGYPAISAFRRSHTRYALTSTRALVSTDDGLNWSSYPVKDWTPLSLVGTRPPSVYFAERVVMGWLPRWGKSPRPPIRRGVGFTHITDAEKIFGLMRDLAHPARTTGGVDQALPGWEGFLDAGETIVWQGRPYPGVILRGPSLIVITAGAIFLLIPAAMLLTSRDAISGRYAVVAFPFVVFGLAAMLAAPQLGAYRRRNSWYALTDRRAVIATRFFWQRSLDSYTIDQWTHLVLKKTRFPSVFFVSKAIQTGNGTRYRNIGFDHIEEGAHVYEMMRHIKDGAT